MVAIVTISAILATLGLLKIKPFRNKGYAFTKKNYHVTRITLQMGSFDQL